MTKVYGWRAEYDEDLFLNDWRFSVRVTLNNVHVGATGVNRWGRRYFRQERDEIGCFRAKRIITQIDNFLEQKDGRSCMAWNETMITGPSSPTGRLYCIASIIDLG